MSMISKLIPASKATLGSLVLMYAVTTSAYAQTAGGFQYDSSLPIEVAADALEVRQEDQSAVFTGSVIARQGTVQLEAQRVEIYYIADGASGGNAAAPGSSNIRSLTAQGDVFIASDDATAQSDWAEYDTTSGVVTMGDNVILTQADNVLTGTRLTINVNTGFARIEGGGGGAGRVTGVFAPQSRP